MSEQLFEEYGNPYLAARLRECFARGRDGVFTSADLGIFMWWGMVVQDRWQRWQQEVK